MICVLSFCSKDQAMAYELAKHIECLGGVQKHRCLLLHPSDTDARDIAVPLERAFSDFSVYKYPARLNGWPDGPNQCYEEAAQKVFELATDDPWLWMEADCVVTRPTWLDEIAHEYRYCGLPILGALENTFDAHGKIIGQHVTGVAVYPSNWWKECSPLRTMARTTETYRMGNRIPPAFDVYLAPYTVPKCAHGDAMRHYWKSRNYREENGVVLCDFDTDYGASNVVDMRAALLHGCKDYSLLNLVQSRLIAA